MRRWHLLSVLFIMGLLSTAFWGPTLSQSCDSGPATPFSNQTNDLDRFAPDWGVFCENAPIPVMGNVSAPATDGAESLRCGILGGVPYSNVHCYRNLYSEPDAGAFTLELAFLFNASPHTCAQNDSVVQALEFTANKWYEGKRYEIAVQWQNIGAGAPQWRYWDPYDEVEQWVPFVASTACLGANTWHTLKLEGYIDRGHVHYQRFTLNGGTPVEMDITVPSACILGTPEDVNRLAVAVQVDGNATQTPYDLFIDEVNFIRDVATPPPGVIAPALIAPADSYRTTITRPAFSWNAVAGATGYELEYGTNTPARVELIPVNGLSFTPAMPLLPWTYYWRVRATGVPSEWSEVRCFRIDSPDNAAPIRNFYVTLSPTLTWNRITWAASYWIQVADNPDFVNPVINDQTIPATAVEWTIDTLPGSGVYYWRLRARRSDDVWGAWSATERFIVDAP